MIKKKTLFFKKCFKSAYKMISEGSCDSEDWSKNVLFYCIYV